jgi:Na+-transporting methylmalonyl-CoA/oxaloacetate decarboxylase gamma subunit
MSVIAFSIVFLVIAGLMVMMMLLKHVARAVEGTGAKPSAPAAVSAPAGETRPAQNIAAAVPVSYGEQDDGELVAVLAAAITASTGTAAAVLSFAPVVPQFARQASSVWKMAGILDNSRGLRD